jgi:2-amino-4-hydroxy-6-hydroxymethyldihydropteridine diphosphokinase
LGPVTVTAAIALGSNLGDRRAHLQFAIERLSTVLSGIRVSRMIESDPVDVSEPQPPYLNGALVGETTMPARELLGALLSIERERGRVRIAYHAPRTLDLDLILYGDTIIDDGDLQVPHPRFRERGFVLEPLKEIAPDMVDPVTGKRIQDL